MLPLIKHICRLFLILGFYVAGMFLHAYNPTVDEEALVVAIQQKIDELATQELRAIEPLHTKIADVRRSKVGDSSYPERKRYVLEELETYIFETYMQVQENVIDIVSDDSLLKYVGPDHPFTNLYYIPADLTMLFPTETISLAVSDELSYMMIREAALPWLQELSYAFAEQFNKPLKINSAWRSFEFQRDGFSQECRDSGLCADPGHSEHQLGLAVDISGMFGDPYLWMTEHAHTYGFHQTYQKGREIDGYEPEKWHWRFVGVEIATQLHESGLTFTEWVRQLESQEN